MRHCCSSQARLGLLFLEYNAFKSPYIVATTYVYYIYYVSIRPWWTHFTSSYFWQRLASLWNGAVIHSAQDSFSHHTRFSKDKWYFWKTDDFLPQFNDHSWIRGVLIQSCSAGAKNFTKCVFYHVQFSGVIQNIAYHRAIFTLFVYVDYYQNNQFY